MKLIDILVEELPKRGGWPNLGILAVQDVDKWICFSTLPAVEINGGEWGNNGGEWVSCIKNCEHLAEDYSKAIITREQYEAALAASKTEWDGEGLPPVGCECEFFDCEKWFKVTMMYGGSQLVVLYDHDNEIERSFSTSHIDGKFRPIRSEADKKRAECVIALSRIDPQAMPFEYGDKHSDGSLIGPFWYELYDAIAAGKIPHIRID